MFSSVEQEFLLPESKGGKTFARHIFDHRDCTARADIAVQCGAT
jgi:hypothetical protein